METEIRKYVLEQYPLEACGIISNGEFLPVNNIADEPETSFKMDGIQLAKLLKDHPIDEIIHSHTFSDDRKPLFDLDPCTPSQSDYINQQKHNVPWRIYATEGENVTPYITFPQPSDTELLGRDFMFYVNDCYTLIRDFYAQKMGVKLELHSNDWTWEDGATTDCYEEFFKDWNFDKIGMDELQYGDIIIMSVMGECNHAGIYIGNSEMIHHMVRRKSDTILVPRMNSFIRFALRYRHDS